MILPSLSISHKLISMGTRLLAYLRILTVHVVFNIGETYFIKGDT